MKNQYLHLRCTEQLKRAIEQLAKKEQRSVSDYLTLLLEKHVKTGNETTKSK